MKRIHAMDGLRGLAALAVLMHHILMSNPIFANAYYQGSVNHPIVWLLTFTPFRALWAGPEAVTLFFVISGVALASLYQKLPSYISYAKSRIVRLYVPSISLVLICTPLALLLGSHLKVPSSSWLNHVTPLHTLSAGQLTLRGVPGLYPLWSTRVEILLSLAIPVAMWLTRVIRTGLLIGLMLAVSYIGFSFVGSLDVLSQLLAYGPFFIFGVAIKTKSAGLLDRLKTKPHFFVVLGIGLIAIKWSVVSEAPILLVIQGAGAAAIVLGISRLKDSSQLLESRLVRWSGTRSFSLYLAHGPVVYFFAYFFGSNILTMCAMAICSLALTELVERFLIRPTHKSARRLLLK